MHSLAGRPSSSTLSSTFPLQHLRSRTLRCALGTSLFISATDSLAPHPQTCLSKTDLRAHLVNSLRSLMERRLLHPGADTKDIITQYIATIKCLRILDPPGVLLSRVADPIRRYLRFVLWRPSPVLTTEQLTSLSTLLHRSRDDTIRCIVSRLMEEENALAEEFAASDARPVQDAKDAAENFNDPKWVPDPVDAPPGESLRLAWPNLVGADLSREAVKLTLNCSYRRVPQIQVGRHYPTSRQHLRYQGRLHQRVASSSRAEVARRQGIRAESGGESFNAAHLAPWHTGLRTLTPSLPPQDQKRGNLQTSVRRRCARWMRGHDQGPAGLEADRHEGARS